MKNKFNAKKTTVDGIVFDSKRESEYYLIYKSMLQHGEIKSLERQPRYEIIPKFGKERAAYYTPDFRLTYPDGRVVVVEVKGNATRDYILWFQKLNEEVDEMKDELRGVYRLSTKPGIMAKPAIPAKWLIACEMCDVIKVLYSMSAQMGIDGDFLDKAMHECNEKTRRRE